MMSRESSPKYVKGFEPLIITESEIELESEKETMAEDEEGEGEREGREIENNNVKEKTNGFHFSTSAFTPYYFDDDIANISTKNKNNVREDSAVASSSGEDSTRSFADFCEEVDSMEPEDGEREGELDYYLSTSASSLAPTKHSMTLPIHLVNEEKDEQIESSSRSEKSSSESGSGVKLRNSLQKMPSLNFNKIIIGEDEAFEDAKNISTAALQKKANERKLTKKMSKMEKEKEKGHSAHHQFFSNDELKCSIGTDPMIVGNKSKKLSSLPPQSRRLRSVSPVTSSSNTNRYRSSGAGRSPSRFRNSSSDNYAKNRQVEGPIIVTKSGKKKLNKRYAASLPDSREFSPPNAEFEKLYFSSSKSPIKESEANIVNLGHEKYHHTSHSQTNPKPSKHCKNLWTRKSIERDILTSPESNVHRHSSYHPLTMRGGGLYDGCHYASPQRMFLSRPASPNQFSDDNSDRGEFSSKTFPRSCSSVCYCCYKHHLSSVSTGSLLGLDYEDRLLRLESDKDTLHLQVSVLSDQIDAQTSKIYDLEKLLDDKKNVLETTEDHLQKELLTRSAIETQKLELMTEISGLRLKHASLERENYELKDRYLVKSAIDPGYNHDVRLWDKPPPLGGPLPLLETRVRLGSASDQFIPNQQPTRVRTPPANAYRRVDQSAFGTLPRRNQSSQLSTFNGNVTIDGGGGGGGSGVNSRANSISAGNINSVNFNSPGSHQNGNQQKLIYNPQMVLGANIEQRAPLAAYSSGGVAGLFYPSSIENPNSSNKSTSAPNLAAIERDDWQKRNKPITVERNTKESPNTSSSSAGGHKSRGILKILAKLKRSNSGGLDNDVSPEVGAIPFTRGGYRATAAPRLGWMKENSPAKKPDGPVSSWNSEEVTAWMNYLGLGMYSNEIKRWVKTGQQLLEATPQELEKELCIKNLFHRKKLNLAIHHIKNPDQEDDAGKLDYTWVMRWLDDIGLPQYKEYFQESRIDGRVLSNITSEELISLKVTSFLHHASIKRGLQILRIHKFNSSCLCRRGSPAIVTNGKGTFEYNFVGSTNPKTVSTWSNHRIMEWLKAIDLAEYAPNLRGSGVHGALIILEPRFNSELMASLLSIPSSKTLLRRHLSLQFNELVGKFIVQEKRQVEISPDFIPINPTMKVKTKEKSKFPLRRKRMSIDVNEELICPLDLNIFPYNDDGTKVENEVVSLTKSHQDGKISNI